MPRESARRTEERIRTTAVRLFNECGYEAVSLRQIAAEAGTTIGNLTYHFPKKEDLLADIVEGLQQEFESVDAASTGVRRPLDAFVGSLRKAAANRSEYPFYFEHLNQILCASQKLMEASQAFQARIYERMLRQLRGMRDEGIIQDGATDDRLGLLVTLIVSVEVSWTMPVSPARNPSLHAPDMVGAVIGLLDPYLTELGREELARLTRTE